jgi:hypothetical protein
MSAPSKEKKRRVVFSCPMDPGMRKRVRAHCKKNGLYINAVVAALLDAYLDQQLPKRLSMLVDLHASVSSEKYGRGWSKKEILKVKGHG